MSTHLHDVTEDETELDHLAEVDQRTFQVVRKGRVQEDQIFQVNASVFEENKVNNRNIRGEDIKIRIKDYFLYFLTILSHNIYLYIRRMFLINFNKFIDNLLIH